MNEKISVIMSVYNEEKEELQLAIESILKQTYSNFEFIIIIDNPNDKWREQFIRDLNDKRIILLKNEKNIGLPLSLNRGIEKASGTYIVRMDADDISEVWRLEKQIKFLKQNKLDLCGCNYISFCTGDDLVKVDMPKKNVQIEKMLKYQNCIAHPTWFGTREIFKKNDGYRNIHTCEDLDFLLRAQQNGFKMANVQEYLLKYRFNRKSISRTNAGKQKAISEYLCKQYKKGKIPTEKEICQYINTQEFGKKVKKYDEYINLKNGIKYNKNNKNIIQMIFYLNILITEIKNKIIKKIIEMRYKSDFNGQN